MGIKGRRAALPAAPLALALLVATGCDGAGGARPEPSAGPASDRKSVV